MNALTQYLDLYRDYCELFDRGSSSVLNSVRREAWNRLQGAELPTRHTPGYEKTSIEDIFAPDLGLNLNRLPLEADLNAPFRCGIPHASTLLALLVNDRFVPSSALLNNLPAGVTVTSLAGTADNKAVNDYYGRIASLDNPGAALNTLLAQDGILIHIAAGVKLDKPIQIVNLTSTNTPTLSSRRILIVAEPDSRASLLLCDHTAPASQQSVISQVVEVVVGDRARIDVVDIEENTRNVQRYNQVWARVASDAIFNWGGMTLHNGLTRNEYRVDIIGERSSVNLSGMAIGNETEHIDNSSDVRHSAPRSKSNQLFKYVLDDHSTGAFQGSIEVTANAPFTEAYQVDRNLLSSPSARMYTKPQLLIYNDDVKCSHGATTGQLDERALFYMRSRGIPLQQARQMLVQAFMSDVVESIDNEVLRDRLRHLVERRLQGHDTHCDDCSTACK